MSYTFTARLWLYPGPSAWVFITVPKKTSNEIKHAMSEFPRRGFGSVRVLASVRGVSWKTSIFPDSKEGAYILPIKKAVRRQAGLEVGDVGELELEIDELSF